MAGRNLALRLSDALRAFGGEPTPAPARARRRAVVRHAGSYRGAEMSRLTGDILSRTQSPVEQLRGDLRILRARARDMALNDPLAKKYLSVMVAQVLGPTGPTLQAQIRRPNGDLDDAMNTRVEEAFRAWCCGPVTKDRTMNMHQFQPLAFRTMIGDGEIFVKPTLAGRFRHGIALQGIDADQVDETMIILGNGQGNEVWLGVEVDPDGERQAYHVFDGLYSQSYSTRRRVRIEASEITHCFLAERFNQARGVTWFAPVMVPALHLNGYVEAVMVGSRAGASQMAFITQDPDQVTSTPAETEGDSAETTATPVEYEMAPATITRLAPGEGVEAFNPAQPTELFDPFTTAVSRFIATGLNVSYASLTGDFSKANYSSERAARFIERLLCKMIQQVWVYQFNQPIYERWLEAAVLSNTIQLPTPEPSRYKEARWHTQGFDWVDPTKDLEATKLELQMGLTSLTRVLAEKGDDFEGMLREIKKERAVAKAYGLDLAAMFSMGSGSPAPAAATTTEEPEPDPEDDAEADEDPADE